MTATARSRVLILTWYALAAIVPAAVAATVIAVWPATAAAGVPYDDPQSIGAVTLYNKAGAVVSAGKVTDRPFVWRAVSSSKAPAPYDKEGRKATLLAYQPRAGSKPAEWSGDTLTGSTGYQDVNHPTVQATDTDFTLKDFLDGFPAQWNGFVQLRVYFGAPEQPTLTARYATADIRVTGDSWSLVRSGTNGAAAGGAAAGASGDTAGAGTGGDTSGAGSGTADNAASGGDTRAAGEILPAVDTPRTLIVSAAAVVGVVLLGLIRRRRPTPAVAAASGQPRQKQPA